MSSDTSEITYDDLEYLRSVAGHLAENEPVTPEIVVRLRKGLKKDEVREGSF